MSRPSGGRARRLPFVGRSARSECRPLPRPAGAGEQAEEGRPPLGMTAEVVEIAPVRQVERPESLPELLAEPLGGRPAGVVAVEDAVDVAGPGEKAQPLGRQGGAAWAEGRQ